MKKTKTAFVDIVNIEADKVNITRTKLSCLAKNNSATYQLTQAVVVCELYGVRQIVLNSELLEISNLNNVILIEQKDLDHLFSSELSPHEKINIIIWQEFFENVRERHSIRVNADRVYNLLLSENIPTEVVRYFFNCDKITQVAFCKFIGICHKNFNKKWKLFNKTINKSKLKSIKL